MKSEVEVTQSSNISQSTNNVVPSRNYRVKKDFDSIQKIDFVEQSFSEIKEKMLSFLNEIVQMDESIKYKLIKNENHLFEVILVNRHKIGADSSLSISIPSGSLEFNSSRNFMFSQIVNIDYSIKSSRKDFDKGFKIASDDYRLFWSENDFYGSNAQELGTKEITNKIWDALLESVDIL